MTRILDWGAHPACPLWRASGAGDRALAITNFLGRDQRRMFREMHVFQLIGSGLGTKKIAHSLNLSVKTIEAHRENIKRKLGLNSGGQLIEHATKWVEENFLPPQKGEPPGARKKKVVPFRAA